VSRDQHPASLNSISVPEQQQVTLYESFKKSTRGLGQLGKGLCNMKFLSQDNLKLEAAEDQTSYKSRHTLINEKHRRGYLRMDNQLGRNNKLLRSSATKERVVLSSMSSTDAVYNPNFEVGMVRLDRGMAVLEKQLSRDKLPSGKPLKGPNLVVMPP
jgi:hypothetical protein